MSHVDRHSLATLIRDKMEKTPDGVVEQRRDARGPTGVEKATGTAASNRGLGGLTTQLTRTHSLRDARWPSSLQRRRTTRTALHLLRKTFPRRTLHGWVASLENPTKHARKKFQFDINSKKRDEDEHFPVPLCAQASP